MSSADIEVTENREWVYLDTGEIVEMCDAEKVIATIEDDVAEDVGPMLAAAPEMLAALKRQAANIKRWLETGIPAGPEESRSIADQIDAAIAKAEGWA